VYDEWVAQELFQALAAGSSRAHGKTELIQDAVTSLE